VSTVERSVHCHCHGINLVLKLQTKPGYVLSLSIAHAVCYCLTLLHCTNLLLQLPLVGELGFKA
jgi:hypothetical protein